tara:strand:- start:1327 stop:2136 length:810 start_codon:yes stop_codon:yes gene_type:complete
MESNLQSIVDKWVAEEPLELKDVSPVAVVPDFNTPLPQSYPRKEKTLTLKEGVRVAATTATVLQELGMKEGNTYEPPAKTTKKGRPKTKSLEPKEESAVDLLDPTNIFNDAFGVTSSQMGEAQAVCDAGVEKLQQTDPEEIKVPATRLYNTYTASKLATILTEYDQQVVADAAQMRTYVTNKLIEVSGCGDTKQELRALELLGKISDVGLFSEKTEINVTHTTESLEHSIKDKINRLMGQIHEAEFEEVPTLEVIEEEPDGSEEGFETS